MFNIDDDFLTSIGYNTNTLSEEKKGTYKAEILDELNQRLSAEVAVELDEEQVSDLESIQNNAERAKEWLQEFHAGYETADDYKAAESAVGEQEALTFYAGALWLQYAVPDYGKLAEEIMAKYHSELVEKRKLANQALGL